MIPRKNQLLVKITKTKEGYQAYFFIFKGRILNEKIALLLAKPIFFKNKVLLYLMVQRSMI